MNWFDILLLVLLAFYAWNGLFQGFVKQVVSFLGFLVAFGLALYGSRMAADILAPYIPMEGLLAAQETLEVVDVEIPLEDWALIIVGVFCFIIFFVVLQYLFRLFIRSLKLVNRIPLLGKFNALGGGALGLLKGSIFVLILVSLLSLVPLDFISRALDGSEVVSAIYLYVQGLAELLRDLLLDFFY